MNIIMVLILFYGNVFHYYIHDVIIIMQTYITSLYRPAGVLKHAKHRPMIQSLESVCLVNIGIEKPFM